MRDDCTVQNARSFLSGKFIAFDVAVLTLIMLVINYPYYASTFVPCADTLLQFHLFHFFYSELYYHGHVAEWFPYGTYGLPGHFYFIIESSLSWAFMFLGALLKIKNALALFKASMIFEQLLLLLGTYLFSRKVFTRRSTVFVVCLVTECSTIWFSQYFFNFRLYFLLPLVLYFLVTFFEDRRPECFWLAGITCLVWGLGLLYGAVLVFYVLAVIFLALLFKYGDAWRCIFCRSPKNWLFFALFAVLLAACAYYQLNAADNILVQRLGRDPVTKRIPLEVFLTYGGSSRFAEVLWCFLVGWPCYLPAASPWDNTVYIGLLPLVFFIWAVFNVKEPLFRGMAISAIALAAFSFGGVVAKAAFHLPGMPLYRHIGLVYGLVKMLMILCAGFGWERFLLSKNRFRYLSVGSVFLIFLLLGGYLIFSVENNIVRDMQPEFFQRISRGGEWLTWTYLRAAVYLVLPLAAMVMAGAAAWVRSRKTDWRIPEWGVPAVLISGLLFDVLSFQYVVAQEVSRLPPALSGTLDSFRVNRLEFQGERYWKPVNARQQQAKTLTDGVYNRGAVHGLAYNFIQFDPCKSEYRSDWWSPGVPKLLDAASANYPGARAFSNVFGFESPKLRLVPQSVFLASDEAVWQRVRESPDFDQAVILKKKGEIQRASSVDGPQGDIRVLDFNANRLDVEARVSAKDGAWLVYADAYDPGWHATVDGRKVTVEAAYLAFKAVWLGPGSHRVCFEFSSGLMSFLTRFIAVFSAVFGFFFFCVFLCVFFPFLGKIVRLNI